MPLDDFFIPRSIEDLANYLGDAFYPAGGFEPDKIKAIAQWIIGREIDDTEVVFLLEKFYNRIQENNPGQITKGEVE